MWENLLCFILKIGIKMWWALLGKKVGSKICGFQLKPNKRSSVNGIQASTKREREGLTSNIAQDLGI